MLEISLEITAQRTVLLEKRVSLVSEVLAIKSLKRQISRGGLIRSLWRPLELEKKLSATFSHSYFSKKLAEPISRENCPSLCATLNYRHCVSWD